ncbi:MAG: glycosyltransferase family 4 protein [Patescibacteria group bacterium]
MASLPYNILTISWDPTLASDSGDYGDAQKRNIAYGAYVANLFSVTYSKKSSRLGNKKLSDNVFIFPTNSRNPISFLWDAWLIAKDICQKNQIDLVLTQDPFLTAWVGIWLKRKFSCKLLIHFHGDFFANEQWRQEAWVNRFLLILGHWTVTKADALRVMSQGIKEKLIKFGLPTKIIRVIPTPVDLEKFNNLAEVDFKPHDILSVGRLVAAKDFPTLIAAAKIIFQRYPDLHLKIIGQGPEYNNLKKIVQDSPFIDIVGAVDHDDLPAEYNQCSVFVMSSTNESFGKVLVEANACAKPVVSTATTGAVSIVRDGYNGYLVPIGDPSALAEKIIYLFEHASESKAMGLNGQKLVRELFSDNTEKIAEFWSDIINNKL